MSIPVRSCLLGLSCLSLWLVAPGCGGDASVVRLNDGGSGGASSTGIGTTSSASSGGGGSTSSGAGGGSIPGVPEPGPQAPGDGPGVVYVVDQIFVGDTNWDGSPNKATGWKQFGLNLDGKVSTKDSVDLCKPASSGVPSAVYPDGDEGIDNSFGKNLLPITLGLAPDYAFQLNDSIDAGALSALMAIDGLGSSADYNPLSARYYAAGDLGATPTFDGSDKFPVTFESLTDPNDVLSAKVQFPSSYLTGNTWVSGISSTAVQTTGFGAFLPNIWGVTLHRAIFVFELDEDHHRVTRGTLAGILDTEEYITAMKSIAGTFDAGLCEGSTFEGLASQIRAASDILIDGTQDPNQVCNGISFGVGFTLVEAGLAGVAPPVLPPEDPCAP